MDHKLNKYFRDMLQILKQDIIGLINMFSYMHLDHFTTNA